MYLSRPIKTIIYLLPIVILFLTVSIVSSNIYEKRFEGRPFVKHLDYGKYYLSDDYKYYEVTKEEWAVYNLLFGMVVFSALLLIILLGIVGFYFFIPFFRDKTGL